MPEVPSRTVDYGGSTGFIKAVYASYRRHGLPDGAARLLAAHASLSSGYGKKAHNYNLQGMKANASWRASRAYTMLRGCECVDGLPDVGDANCQCGPGKGQRYSTMYWRAFDTIDDATASVLATLRGVRYQQAYVMLLRGDPEYFAQVGRDGWYSADPTQTKTNMLRFYGVVNKTLGVPSDGNALGPLVLVGAVLWYYFKT